MRSHRPEELGDEPLYCEAYHDEVLCSGSDDEHYYASEHRRLRIEAKAVQFLDGQIPFLLSARLRGPFDNGWKNPWLSRPLPSQSSRRPHDYNRPVEAQTVASQAPFSTNSVEAPRGHVPDGAIDFLPGTQGTSLCPLPSPEVTNPPSAKKNSYLGEDEYSRIKMWREDVKGGVTRDLFWASQNKDGGSDTSASADSSWLHTRPPKKIKKKRRSDQMSDSPSQRASVSKPKRRRIGRLSTRAIGSSSESIREDEAGMQLDNLIKKASTPKATTPHVINLERSVGNSRKHRDRPISAPRPAFHSFDANYASSEDELYPPASSAMKQIPTLLAADQQANAAQPSSCLQLSHGRTEAEDLQVGRTDTSRQETQQPSLGLEQAHPKRATNLRGESQQDDSFHFHARPRSPRNQAEPLQAPTSHMDIDKTSTTLANAQVLHTGSTPLDLQVQNNNSQHNAEALYAAVRPDKETNSQVSNAKERQRSPGHGCEETSAIAQTSSTQELRDAATPPPQGNDAGEISEKTQNAHAKPPPYPCTQELSPVSMPRNPNIISPLADKPNEDFTLSNANDVTGSDPDWSTYIHTQDLSAVSGKAPSISHVTADREAMTYEVDGTSDSDWSTCVDSQEQTAPAIEDEFFETMLTANEARNSSPTAPDDAIEPDSDWETCLDTSSQTSAPAAGTFSHEAVRTNLTSPPPDIPQDNSCKLNECAETTCSPAAVDEDFGAAPGCEVDMPCSSTLEQEVVIETDDLQDQERTTQMEEAQPTLAGGTAQLDTHKRAETKRNEEAQSSSYDPYATTVSIDSASSALLQEGSAAGETRREVDTGLHTVTHSSGQVQSPWYGGEQTAQHAKLAPLETVDISDEATASVEPLKKCFQSPWVRDETVPLPPMPEWHRSPLQSPSKLVAPAGEALAVSSGACQTPWLGDKLPSPNFTMSVKRFSDFMEISPVKRPPASVDGSILRSSGTCRLLFEPQTTSKPKRRVTFAPLSGESGLSFAESNLRENSENYEDLSYFDQGGNKTTSIRVGRPIIARIASPPPRDLDLSEVAELPDHDRKFASHFEAVSKQKKNLPRKVVRLLPFDSQLGNGSQQVDAMAEAFIQASQTRKKNAEMTGTKPSSEVQSDCSRKMIPNSVTAHAIEEQENIEPVDDVSAVLDNLDDFLDNTWGADTSAGPEHERQPSDRQQKPLTGRFESAGDPMVALNVNVWAD